MRAGEMTIVVGFSDDRLLLAIVCALSVLELGLSVVRYVNDAGSEIHLSSD
jgi:hypothetical protein